MSERLGPVHRSKVTVYYASIFWIFTRYAMPFFLLILTTVLALNSTTIAPVFHDHMRANGPSKSAESFIPFIIPCIQ